MLAEVETRLKAQVATLKMVAGAAAFSELEHNPPKSKQPAAYVLLVSEQGSPNAVQNAVRQLVTVRIAVALALGNFKDRRGATATQQIETLKDQVIAALLDWPPETGMTGCLFGSGRIVRMLKGVVWYQLEFTTTEQLSS